MKRKYFKFETSINLSFFLFRDILAQGGNAVDAAIATTVCIGAVNPQSAGIGGGFHMTLYDPVKRVARCLDAREVAPIAATEDMFKGNSSISQRGHFPIPNDAQDISINK